MQKKPIWVTALFLIAIMSWGAVAIAGDRGNSKECQFNADALQEALAEFGQTELIVPGLPPNITFVPAVLSGDLLHVSGGGPALPPPDAGPPPDGFITGRVPSELSIDEAIRAAKLTALNQLAVIEQELGSLHRVKRFVKLFGMVNTDPGFTDHPAIINGASNLLVAVFGECGFHARSAVGMASLPFNIPVEIDMIVEVRRGHSGRGGHDD